ncbi:hypothetical protein GOODEAATRI_032376, partial [Goodea atripinnis]
GGDHSPGVRRHHQIHGDRKMKVIRLSELMTVLRLPPNAEACPMKTDAATRCGLQGSYWLQVEQQSLLLRDAKKKTVMEWPYELLRRYGSDKSNIKRKSTVAASGHQNLDIEKVSVTNIQAYFPLPKIPDMTHMAATMENKLRMQDRRSPVFDDMAKSQEDSSGPSEGAPAPITLMPLPSVPMHDNSFGDKHSSQSDPIYADPKDCVSSVVISKPIKAQYIDPASVLPLKPPCSQEPDATLPTTSDSNPHPNADVLDSVYSEVYDKISPDQNKRPVLQKTAKMADEPIYSEPVTRTDSECQKTEPKPDPFTHLYAQVCKAATLSKNSAASVTTLASSSTKSREETLGDVIYENLGII